MFMIFTYKNIEGLSLLLIGSLLSIRAVIALVLDFKNYNQITFFNYLILDLFSLAISIFFIVTGCFVLKSKNYDTLFKLISYSILMLYGLIFILFGGMEDVSILYSICVLSLFSLSIIGLVMYFRKRIS